MPLEAPSVLVLGVGDLSIVFVGEVSAALIGLDASSDVVSLEDLRSGLTAGCCIVNESDFIHELLGSLRGLLNR